MRSASHVDVFIRSGDICDQSVELPKIAPNFGRFLPSEILREAVPQKVYPRYHARLTVRRLEKFGEVDPPGPKVIGAHSPNFKPIFEFLLLKIVGGTPIPLSLIHI